MWNVRRTDSRHPSINNLIWISCWKCSASAIAFGRNRSQENVRRAIHEKLIVMCSLSPAVMDGCEAHQLNIRSKCIRLNSILMQNSHRPCPSAPANHQSNDTNENFEWAYNTVRTISITIISRRECQVSATHSSQRSVNHFLLEWGQFTDHKLKQKHLAENFYGIQFTGAISTKINQPKSV